MCFLGRYHWASVGFASVLNRSPASLLLDVIVIDDGATPYATSLTAPPADWETYEGGLVTLADVGVIADPTEETYGESATDWGISIDDMFFEHGTPAGTSIGLLTGVIHYSWGTYKICPRSPEDID